MQRSDQANGEIHLYQAVARELSDAIGAGTLKMGDRLPSTRKLVATGLRQPATTRNFGVGCTAIPCALRLPGIRTSWWLT